jgi:hypothetical protein
MKGDFSRLNMQAKAENGRVMMQQGRVLLDSDWNEQSALFQEALRQLARDIFGAHGGAKINGAFTLSPGFKIEPNLRIKAGRYYVNGIAVETEDADYDKQIGYPFADFAGKPGSRIEDIPGKNWIAYLDVWEDYVSPSQDKNLIETALGGADTCGRARVNWRVKILLAQDPEIIEKWSGTGTGKLMVQTIPSQPDELCVISPDAKYHGLENQLYRVEIHRGGKMDDKPQYKWSRDNGSVVFPVLSGKGSSVELAHLGRDTCCSLKEKDWVEYIDDALLADHGAGILTQVARIERGEDNQIIVVLHPQSELLPAFDGNLNPILRRWDQMGDTVLSCKDATANWVELEDGIQIKFTKEAGDEYHAGDYWLIPARTNGHVIDWPENGSPVLPYGPVHHYAPLAIKTGDALTDLRFATTMARAAV